MIPTPHISVADPDLELSGVRGWGGWSDFVLLALLSFLSSVISSRFT